MSFSLQNAKVGTNQINISFEVHTHTTVWQSFIVPPLMSLHLSLPECSQLLSENGCCLSLLFGSWRNILQWLQQELCPQASVWLWLGLGACICPYWNMEEDQVCIEYCSLCMLACFTLHTHTHTYTHSIISFQDAFVDYVIPKTYFNDTDKSYYVSITVCVQLDHPANPGTCLISSGFGSKGR